MRNRILVLQERAGDKKALARSLGPRHDLTYVKTIDKGLQALIQQRFDLIIARIHLEEQNAFDFLEQVKAQSQFRQIPFVCFNGSLSSISRRLNSVLETTSHVLGADGYICLDLFCTEGACDFEALRQTIERFLQSNQPQE